VNGIPGAIETEIEEPAALAQRGGSLIAPRHRPHVHADHDDHVVFPTFGRVLPSSVRGSWPGSHRPGRLSPAMRATVDSQAVGSNRIHALAAPPANADNRLMLGGWVYIITNRPNGTFYVGVTSDLARRVWLDLDSTMTQLLLIE
jgi:hypothetical protein